MFNIGNFTLECRNFLHSIQQCWVSFWDSVTFSESVWFSEVCFKLCGVGSRAAFTLRVITPIAELWPFWTLSLMPMVLGLPFCGIFHIPSLFGSSQKCLAYCFWVVLVPSLTESLPHICTDRTQPKTHRGPCGDLQSASSVELPLFRTPPCKFLALWFPWHTTIFLFDLVGLVRVTHICAAGWKLPRCSRLGQLEGSTLLFPVFQSSWTGAGPCARPEDNYFIYFVQFSVCLWKEGNSCRGWSFIEAEV